ncbi:hypothetical protein RT761_02668 [Atribacter laminatus]|uniref:Transposase IS204/IS1001/IS1096/IS1165 DDE domain-containing protein n=1 Tax=Atribacter laminatus TaxID=2847778 RepID=A0A7T1F466_ATRLM|nr:transposase [Atribacter laminatus]QPM69435.1 hypothetical protein RT761_02668 [Atribacter laminatus]
MVNGSKYLLLKNQEHLLPQEILRLQREMELNQNLSLAYILKDSFKELWEGKSYSGSKNLEEWCAMAYVSHLKTCDRLCYNVQRLYLCIYSHCSYSLHTSLLEGINSKFKVIKREAFDYHDLEYFSSIIKDSFVRSN